MDNKGKRNKKKRISFILMFLIIWMAAQTAFAEGGGVILNASGTPNRTLDVDPIGRKEGFSTVLFDNSNGLPTSEANAIAETSDGFIWIGSYAGLIRYDGNTFERMDLGGLASIKCLYVDSRDRLWIGTNDNGIAVLEKGELRKWGKLDGMRSAHTRALTEGPDGTIYIATTVGIAMIDPEFNLSMLEDEIILDADMRYICASTDGVIYGSTDQGDLIILKDKKLYKFIPAAENPLGGVGTFLPDPEGNMKIYQEAVDFGLYHVDLSKDFTVLEKLDVSPLKYLLSLEYIDGKIWVCGGNGIGVLEGKKFTLLDNLPLVNNVGHVMTDYLGNLWFTSTRQGVMKVVPNQFSNIFDRYDLPETVVNSTCVCDGKLFAATDTGLLAMDEKGAIKKVPLKRAVTASGEDLGTDDLIEFLDGSRIRSVIMDSRGRMWISTWRACGLLCYDKGELTAYDVEDGLLTNNIRAVYEMQDGRIMVALTGGANVIQDGKVVASYGREDGILTTETLTVAEGLNGEVIIGSNGGGLYIFGESGLKTVNVEEGLPSDIVMRLRPDKKRNVIWIVTSSAIAYMTPDYQVTTVERFPYTNNFDLYENSRGDIWVLSSNGIYVVPGEEMLANGAVHPVYYSTANGLSCIATANSYSALTQEGDLYIAGSTGICKVNIEQPFENIADLKATVPYVEADGQRIFPDASGVFLIPSTTQKLTLPSFVFNYSLNNPKVSYQLIGFDRQSTTVNRSELKPVDYTNLRGGDYHFVMKLQDSMGHGSKEISVLIRKEKAFYEEIWFIALALVACAGILVLIISLFVRRKMQQLEKKRLEAREMFEQTAEALAGAIDAKDKYTNGHSRRVAVYSQKIAQEFGKSEEECDQIYFAALLHDVGKIGVPLEILSKKGRLTDEEFQQIKSHPVVGGQILESIRKSPWLSIGARYHHERYNGKGYPEGLKGEKIPEIARIIAVADAYDAMTSNRSYRSAIPQHIVREELVKGIGTQFDPKFAKIMIHLIDLDTEFKMQESISGTKVTAATSLRCESIYHDCSEGIGITDKKVRISMCSQPDEGFSQKESLPTLILFDSLDAKVHPGEENNKDVMYYEYARIRLDGQVKNGNVRKVEVRKCDRESDIGGVSFGETQRGQRYLIEAYRNRDHVQLFLSDEEKVFEVILALPDTARYAYISLSGEHCEIHNVRVESDLEKVDPQVIPRIADEISYIRDCPVGDIPNVQIDGPRLAASEGILIRDEMTLTFHTMSLPTARLVWHCPFLVVFASEDGKVNGAGYREYALLRLDGESWEADECADDKISVVQEDSFEGWNVWKEKNKQGFDCTVEIKHSKNQIMIRTENLGISIESIVRINDRTEGLYVALTGDQCAISNIRIK